MVASSNAPLDKSKSSGVSASLVSVAVTPPPTSSSSTSAPKTSTLVSTGKAASAPAWVATLSDSVLAADMTAIAATGTCTEAQMAKVFQDLVAELKTKGASLSSAQFADLKTIVANLAALGASSYVQYIAGALVGGNAANATWTGGSANSVALGNLAAGSSSTQLSELTAKWFLGADDPSNTVSMSGTSSFTVSYTTNKLPLFASGGPSINDINQGYLGDCWLLSSLGEAALQNSSRISSMITDNGNGTYGVRFYFGGKTYYVTVDGTLPDGGSIFNSGKADWAGLVEKAFSEWSAASGIQGYSSYTNSFNVIGNGGDPAVALEAITGASAITDFAANGSKWSEYTLNSSLNWTGSSSATNATALSQIAADLLVGNDVILCSYTTAKDSAGKYTLIGDHAMSVTGYDAATGMLQIRNPWGSESWQYWDTTFEVGLNTLLADGDWITADNAGTATSVSGASAVAAAGLQAMSQIKSFTVSDSVANVTAQLAGLKTESKLSGLTVNGTAGADAINLTGENATTTLNLGANSDKASLTALTATASGYDTATAISLGASSTFDAVTLGGGATTINYTLGSGVLDVANFSAARDLLSVNLGGASLLQTIVGGSDWISSSTDTSHGVLLAGVGSVQKVTVSGGVASVA